MGRLFKWIGAAVVAVWFFLQGFATIWTAFSQDTVPVWLSKNGWLGMSFQGVWGFVPLLVGIGILVVATKAYWPFKFPDKPTAGKPVDPIEEGRTLHALNRSRSHIYDLVRKYLMPSHAATSEVLVEMANRLKQNPNQTEVEFGNIVSSIVYDTTRRMGNASGVATRAIQDAPDDSKPALDQVLDAVSRATLEHFVYSYIADRLRMLPQFLLSPPPGLSEWRLARERLRDELRVTAGMEGFRALREHSAHYRSDTIPENAPKVVPSRYGGDPKDSPFYGLFIKNLGGAAKSVVVRDIRLGRQTVQFSGPELTQLEKEDGERCFDVSVAGQHRGGGLSTDLRDSFRQWQNEQGDLNLETVGVIQYKDFDGVRYESHYRLGIDAFNEDGGMVVEFLEQRQI